MYDICVVSMICNEIEILPMYYRYIKKWCKSWKVLDHGSTDGSVEFLKYMSERNEINIEVFQRECGDFDKDFYKEWNWILDKVDCKWTYVGHIDEFCPYMDTILSQMFKFNAIYIIRREEMISLFPPLSFGKETPFMRIFPTDWKIRFIEGNHVHREEFNPREFPVREAQIPFYHLGECRNSEHVRFKEKAYEDCSGDTIFGSKYTEKDRQERRKGAHLLKDEHLPDLMDMIL